MSEGPTVTARMTHRRMMAASMRAHAARNTSTFWLLCSVVAVLLAAIWLSGPIAFLLVQSLPAEWMFTLGPALPSLVMWVLGLSGTALVLLFHVKRQRARVERHFAALRIPLEFDVTHSVLPEGFRATSDRMHVLATWQSVTALNRHGKDWVLQADQLTFVIPAEALEGDQRSAFLCALASYLTPAALARSPDLSPYVKAPS